MKIAWHITNSQISLGGLARQASWWCAILTITLQLLQPLLCTITCLVHHYGTYTPTMAGHQHAHQAQASEASASSAAGGMAALCYLTPPATPHVVFVPAFWPGLLPTLSIFLALCGLLHRLIPQIHVRLDSHHWIPLLPPPRLLSA
jgi:hypothetical protein